MPYSSLYISEAQTAFLRECDRLFNEAIKMETLDVLFNGLGIPLPGKSEYTVTLNRRMKILVIGRISGKKDEYYKRAKKLGISSDHIEFIDYEEAARLSPEILRYSSKYSDIIYGPTPHQGKGVKKYGSLLKLMTLNKEQYPHLCEVRDNTNTNDLKFSLSNFERALKQTRYYREVVLSSID